MRLLRIRRPKEPDEDMSAREAMAEASDLKRRTVALAAKAGKANADAKERREKWAALVREAERAIERLPED